MNKPSTKTKIAVAVVAPVLLATALFGLPLAFQLSRIGKVRDQYRLDGAVLNEVIADPVHKTTTEYFLDPPFMKRYADHTGTAGKCTRRPVCSRGS